MSTLLSLPSFDQLSLFGLRLGGGALLFAVFWLIVVIAEPLLRRAVPADPQRAEILGLLITVARWVFLAFGLVTALGTLGVNTSALVASLGLTGLTIGFALKDIAASLMAGLLLLIYRPFRRGDRVKVTDCEGVVIQVDLRYTHLDAEDRRYLVPNSIVLTNAVTVHKAPPAGP